MLDILTILSKQSACTHVKRSSGTTNVVISCREKRTDIGTSAFNLGHIIEMVSY